VGATHPEGTDADRTSRRANGLPVSEGRYSTVLHSQGRDDVLYRCRETKDHLRPRSHADQQAVGKSSAG